MDATPTPTPAQPHARPPADVNYTFNEAELEALTAYGEVRRHEAGAILVHEGDRRVDNLITLSGQTDIFVEGKDGPTRLGWMERGQFSGDIGVLTGQTSLASVTMGEAGEVLHIPFEQFQRLLVENSALSDIFVRTFTARRVFARTRTDAPVIVLGSALDRSVFALRDFLTRHGAPHSWYDPVTDRLGAQILEAKGLQPADLPVVVMGAQRVLIKPTVNDIAAELGSDLLPDGATADVIVVGAGPAGLAASVYAGSEGLTVLTLDADAPGGQAGTSSKIENYLGFPMGVSGRELADRAAIQAQKFGVRLGAPVKASKLQPLEDGAYCVHTEDGRTLKARAVVIATGAQYRRLPIENLEQFEGRGVYYGASPLEAQLCSNSDAVVVGAGNSAGQGAVFLSRTAHSVHVMYRRADIRDTMSEYLVRRLEEAPNIHLHPQTEIDRMIGAEGDETRLAALDLTTPGGPVRLEAGFAFLFIGAAPFTQWLPDAVARDTRGFLKTGLELETLDLVRAGWTLGRMPSVFETSLPRVYAVGDVRAGSVKRVASGVGEGSVVVSHIHSALGEVARD
jgi:thioredoxin reductase (NADPH)